MRSLIQIIDYSPTILYQIEKILFIFFFFLSLFFYLIFFFFL